MLRTVFHRFGTSPVKASQLWSRRCSAAYVLGAIAMSSLAIGQVQAQPEVAIEADTIEYDQSVGLVRAEGNFIVTQGRAKLQGDRGSYNNASGQSILIGNTTLMVGDREFNTRRLEGNHRNEIFLLEGDVNSPLDTDLEVRSDAMVYRGATAEATFTGDVEVISPKWTIIASRAQLNEGELLLFDGWKEPNSTETTGSEGIEPLPSLFEDSEVDGNRELFDSLTLDISTRIARLNVSE